jgi:hypothetical protein
MMIEMNMRKDRFRATFVEAASRQPNLEIDKEELCKKLAIKAGNLTNKAKKMEVQLAEAKVDYKHERGGLRDLEINLKRLYDNDIEKAPVDSRDQYIESQDSYLHEKNCYTTVKRFIDTTVSEITVAKLDRDIRSRKMVDLFQATRKTPMRFFQRGGGKRSSEGIITVEELQRETLCIICQDYFAAGKTVARACRSEQMNRSKFANEHYILH